MADIGLGTTSLAITLISDVTKVLQYFLICLRDSKHFGKDVRIISTQINTETARLEAFQEFLKEKTFEDNTRFELLPRPHQAAIVGMVQELEILFGTYRTRLAKYGISELQGDTRIDHLPALDATPLDDTDELVRRGTMASIAAQQSVPGKEKVSWALFKKKNIFNIVRKLEDWNNKLQSFLLCGLCFLDDAKLLAMKDQSTLRNLRLAPGLLLRTIITGANSSTIEIIEDGFTLATPSENSNLRTLIPTDGSGGSETVHVEYKPYRLRRGATQPPEAVVHRVRALGNLLCQPTAPDAGFHTLRCRCILKEKDPNGRALNRYAFVFHLPDTPGGNTEPVNLFTVITAQTHLRPTLGERFKIAQTIATTAFQLHSVGWLHKSIRSENILFFPKPDSPSELDYSRQYLVGFEFSRDENDTSTTEQDDVLERNIYRHPDRQGPPDTRFSILHDVYAIGVVLLEIGLWRPVVEFDPNFPDMGPDDVRQTLETHARLRLPHYMGKAYTEAVLACLGGRLGEGANGGGARNVGAVETVSRNIEQLREEVQLVYNERVMGGIESGLSLE